MNTLRKTLAAAMLCALSPLSLGQAADDFEVPRTQWGHPDLQGVWNFSSSIPMQRPEQYGEREFLNEEEVAALRERLAERDAASDQAAPQTEGSPGGYNDFWVESAGITDHIRTSHIVYPLNGRLPRTVEGAPLQYGGLGPDTPGERPVRFTVGGVSKDGPEDRGLSERCIIGFNSGPPFTPSMYNNNVQIFQNKDTAVVMTEMIHDARIVPIYDSAEAMPKLDDDIELWTGDSKGYYEGDTLVVVTRNFNAETQSFSVFGTAKEKVLTERFTRIDPVTVNYEWTIEDPATFTDKITAIVPMTKVAGQLYEYACHEGNYGMVNILRGERRAESVAAEGGN